MPTATASAKPSTPASTRTSAMRGTLAGCSAASALTPANAMATPTSARGHGQHERLGEQLPREPAAARADRQPHRQLALARRRARQVAGSRR